MERQSWMSDEGFASGVRAEKLDGPPPARMFAGSAAHKAACSEEKMRLIVGLVAIGTITILATVSLATLGWLALPYARGWDTFPDDNAMTLVDHVLAGWAVVLRTGYEALPYIVGCIVVLVLAGLLLAILVKFSVYLGGVILSVYRRRRAATQPVLSSASPPADPSVDSSTEVQA